MIKVWVDGCAFENPGQRGVWRVFYEIMHRASDRINFTLGLRRPPVHPLPPGVNVVTDHGRIDASRWDLLSRTQRHVANRWPISKRSKPDVFHSTGFTVCERPIPHVLTVLDVIPESQFHWVGPPLEDSLPLRRRTFQRADALACISQSTAREFCGFYPDLAPRTHVVPLGHEHLVHAPPAASPAHHVGRSDFLYVGQRYGYKNFRTVLDAVAHRQWPEHSTLVVIGPALSDAEKALTDQMGIRGKVRHLGPISDADLAAAYQSAAGLIVPSFQEGFGLPCVEAQSIGCPLLCSDIEVFHEVAGSAALFFNPGCAETLVARVVELQSPVCRDRLIDEGLRNAKRYSWNDAATRMCEVYESALSPPTSNRMTPG